MITQANNHSHTDNSSLSTDSKQDMDTNRVWVSLQKRAPFYGNIAIKMFQKFETVELHGLGFAISTAVEVSQYIVHTGKAVVQKITTSTVRASQKPEMVIILQRTPKALEDTNDDGEEEDDDYQNADNED